MPSDLSADAIRSRSFPGAMRGYDKESVHAFRDEVADRLAELEGKLETLESRLAQLGIETPPDLDQEIKRVAGDLTSILDEARRAATEMRERASLDAVRWRSESELAAESVHAEAQTDAEALRGAAWELATAVLETSRADAERTLEAAEQDALFIRAEAERAEMRAGTEARRAAEDLLRSARADAERLAREAHAESERVLEAARKSAEIAQERARALEDRRSELLRELEATRRSIDELESQMDEAPDQEGGAVSPSTAAEYQPDPSVRVIPAQDVIVPGVIDADEMAAEVEQLRRVVPGERVEPAGHEPVGEPALGVPGSLPAASAESLAVESDQEPPQVPEAVVRTVAASLPADGLDGLRDEPPAEPDERPAAEHAAAETEEHLVDERPSIAADEPFVEPATESVPLDAVADSATDLPDVALDETATAPAVDESIESTEPVPVHEATTNGARSTSTDQPLSARPAAITDLFASLRSRDTSSRPPHPPAGAGSPGTPAPESASAAGTEPDTIEATPTVEAAPPRRLPHTQRALDLRDRLLLPSQNQALRNLKRAIVDLQNVVLESIRVGEGEWSADRAGFAQALGPPVEELATAAFSAGHEAAAELAGLGTEAPPARGAPIDRSGGVGDTMRAAVEEAFQHGFARSAGPRELSAAVSRVFRAWRTDEAERQLRTAAYRAYHEGVVSGLAQLGITEVGAVTVGKRCADCPAVSERSWDPSQPMPDGMILPPAHPECVTTIVPAVGAPIGVSGGEQRDLQ